MSKPGLAWTEVRPGTFERQCSGGENILGHLERKTGGHSELSLSVQLASNEPRDKILIRIKNAWIHLFSAHPEVAVGQRVPEDDDTKTILTYSLFKNEAEAQKWLDTHLLVVEDNYDDLFQRNMDESSDVPNRQARLEVSFEPGSFNICFHLSHVVLEALAAFMLMHTVIDKIVNGNDKRVELERLVSRERTAEQIRNSLPVSTAYAHQIQYKPTEEDEEKGMDHWNEILGMHLKQSICIPSDEGFEERPLRREVAKWTTSIEETANIQLTCRTIGMAPWVLISAAYAKTIQEIYATGDEEGLMLTAPLGTNRWLDRSLQDGEEGPKRGPITSAQMNGHIWLDAEDLDLGVKKAKVKPGQGAESDRMLLANIKKTGDLIRKRTDYQLSHPHMICTAAQDALYTTYMSFANNPDKDPNDTNYAPFPPSFTVAGNVPVPEEYVGDTMEVRLIKSGLGTRTLMNRLWMAIAFHNGQVRVELYYNSKYFKASTIEAIRAGIEEKVLFVVEQTLNAPSASKL